MVRDAQNYWDSGLVHHPEFQILKNNVSETGSVPGTELLLVTST
jgi:hypothetical protein